MEGRHTETHIQTDRRTGILIESEKHSGGQKGDIQGHTFRRTEGQTYIYNQRNIQADRKRYIQRHTFRRTEGQTYIYSQRNIKADRRQTYRDTYSDGQKDRHTYTIRETFRRTEGDIQRHAFRRTERQTYIYSQRNIKADRRETHRDTHSDG